MKRYLVIAHYEGDKAPLKDLMLDLTRQDPQAEFYLVVPATPPPTQTWTWSEEEAYEVAKRRLEATLRELQAPGVKLSGDVVNFAALAAVEEALKKGSFDELIVATPPEAEARTSFEEFREQVRLFSDIPMRHVTAEQAQAIEQA